MATSLKNIKVSSINICGLSSRSKLVVNKYIHDEGCDIVLMQETGTNDINKLKLLNMKTIADTNQACNRGVSVNANHQHSITQLSAISEPYKNIDSSWCIAVFHHQRFIVGTIYVKLNYPNAIEDTINMLNRAQDLCPKYRAKGVVLAGDFNSRNTDWGDSITNEYGNKLKNNIDSTKFNIISPTNPTFVCENGSSFIDLVIVSHNLADKITQVKTDPDVELFSGAPLRGHVPLTFNITISCGREDVKKQEKIDLSKVQWEQWSNDLDQKLSEINSGEGDAHELWERFNEAIQEVTSDHSSTKICCKHSKPYWTAHLSDLSSTLKETRITYRYRNTDDNKKKMLDAKETFDIARKKACEDYILAQTKELNSVQAQHFWKKFNRLNKEESDCKIEPLEVNDELISESDNIEEIMFKTFFEGDHLKEEEFDVPFYDEVNDSYNKIKEEEINSDNSDEINQQEFDINSKITVKEIESAIKSYSSSDKSFDNKKFHPIMMKHFGKVALTLLCVLFNLCLSTSIWVWEEAEVIFLKKEGKDTYAKPGSYRPISISSYIGKIYEKIIAQRYVKFLKAKGFWDSDQEGFTRLRNTIRYLNRLHLGIKEDIEEKRTSLALFIDFEKAFDSIWKKGLLVKLRNMGVRGNIWLLTDKFLHSRKVSLNINGMKGRMRDSSDVGLPQGSALSPILFKIFLMDFCEDLENRAGITKYKFADDGTLKATAESTPQCLSIMNDILASVSKWTKRWRMVINCQKNKTEMVCFSTAENNYDLIPNIFDIGDKVVKLVTKTKVLGLTIDNKLSYNPHSKVVLQKLNLKWHQIIKYCNRNTGFNQRVMVTLIRTLFISCMCYAGHVWMNIQTLVDINKLWYRILKTATGAVFNLSLSSAEMILGLPPILIQNKINRIKHYLKLNMNKETGDRVVQYLNQGNLEKPLEVKLAVRDTMKFIKWKIDNYPEHFKESDQRIINHRNNSDFFQLSVKACSYNKTIMNKYTELLWQESIRNQYQQKGESFIPTPSCKPLVIPRQTSRKTEVMIMSLMYKNNLLNEFLFNQNIVESNLCPNCEEEAQTADHLLFRCSSVPEQYREQAYASLREYTGVDNPEAAGPGALIMASRYPQFIQASIDIVESQSLRTSIELGA